MRQRFSELPLARQFAIAGVALGVALLLIWLLVARWLSDWPPSGAGPIALAVLMAVLTVAIPALLLAQLARRLLRAEDRISMAARRIQSEERETPIPLAETDGSTHRMSVELRRMVDSLFQRIGALRTQNAALQQNVEDRTKELDTIAEVSRQLSVGSNETELQASMLTALEQAIDYRTASIWGRERDSIVLLNYRTSLFAAETALAGSPIGMRLASADARAYEEIETTQEPIVANKGPRGLLQWLVFQLTNEGRTDALYQEGRSWMATPLIVQNRVVAVLRVDHNKADFFTAERQRLLMAVSYQAALAIENARLNAQARDAAVFAERSRIARELHDGVSQSLFASNIIAGTLEKAIDLEPAQAREQLSELQQLNKRAVNEMRMLLYELRPDALKRVPLRELIQATADVAKGTLPAVFDLRLNTEAEPPADVRITVYRIAQEALSNVVKHSNASHVVVELSCPAPDRCMLRIADDGVGMESLADKPGHFGLGNMRERAASIGAAFDLTSTPGQGTEITFVWQPDTQASEDQTST